MLLSCRRSQMKDTKGTESLDLLEDFWGLLLFLADMKLSYLEEDPGLDHNATTIVLRGKEVFPVCMSLIQMSVSFDCSFTKGIISEFVCSVVRNY